MNDLILLAMLLEGPQHGYALKKKVGLITGQGEMHNNLVYPLLKRFVTEGWVSRRSADGQRGQTRELYALSVKGRQELVRSLSDFADKAAGSPEAFRIRVSLFSLLDAATRLTILARRDQWLANRQETLQRVVEGTAVKRGWDGEVIAFMNTEIHAERRWIERLRKKLPTRERAKARR
jgi:DNA-binding PadR family transcriptional regulator